MPEVRFRRRLTLKVGQGTDSIGQRDAVVWPSCSTLVTYTAPRRQRTCTTDSSCVAHELRCPMGTMCDPNKW